MMRRILGLVVTAVTGFLILAACAPTAAPVEPATAVEEPVVESEPEAVEVEQAAIDTSDLTLIGNTGRPQFLNSFASW
jgi:hypothetical protein